MGATRGRQSSGVMHGGRIKELGVRKMGMKRGMRSEVFVVEGGYFVLIHLCETLAMRCDKSGGESSERERSSVVKSEFVAEIGG